MPFGALEEVLHATGDLSGKLVIDCTNAVAKGMSLAMGHTTSAAEKLPGARVFKSFNAQGAENLANPIYDGVRATNFFCGDDADGRRVMKALVEEVGFDAVDAGPLKDARLLAPMMLLGGADGVSGPGTARREGIYASIEVWSPCDARTGRGVTT